VRTANRLRLEKVLKIMDEFESEIPKLFMSAMDPRETALPKAAKL